MVTNRRVYGKAMSMPAGIGVGILVSFLVMISGCGALAKLLEGMVLEKESVGYGAMVVLLMSSFLGSITAVGLVKRRRLLVCVLSALIYFGVLLLINGLMFGGAVSGAGVTALLLAGGAGCGVLTGIGGGSPQRRRTRKRHTG